MVVAIKRANKTAVEPVKDLNVPVSGGQIHEEAPQSDFELTTWKADAQIVCTNEKGIRRYLRKTSLEDLLQQTKDGAPFAFKGMLTSKHLGQPEFLLAMAWMRANGLANKHGRTYVIPSIEAVRRRWNEVVAEETAI